MRNLKLFLSLLLVAGLAGCESAPKIDDAAFTFTSPDPDATFECRIDGGAFVPCAPGVSYPVADAQRIHDTQRIGRHVVQRIR